MDKLLEILESFRCHLYRDNKMMLEFLRDNYAQYIIALKNPICLLRRNQSYQPSVSRRAA